MSEITDPAAGIVAEVAAPVKKTCTKCGMEKVLEDYHLQKGGKFGRHSRCRACQRDLAREYWRRPEGRQKGVAYSRRPEVKERKRLYAQRPDVKERKRSYDQEYRQRPEVKERALTHSQHPGVKNRKKAYAQRPEIRERQRNYLRQYAQKRRKSDPNFRIVEGLRTRLLQALKGNCKSAGALKLLGCTVEELRAHLEAQFKPGMTWENQGRNGWHIDHIRPCASFDLTDPEQQRLCFHYMNLQPLWATENLSKGAKLLDTAPAA